ncbi:protein-L-isoaspartate O-methyltransferase family protein [Neomegalonema perideroedes]|uniref:protein-L-isoaspartate O-methyltransferase family protein n=1 Tax=Neomegalonema perideroedes TaxID=217219 RepID=UPI0003773005|nr:protein-L-isoaspartate O-methyltransferase [Neomegalonema perideroedes]
MSSSSSPLAAARQAMVDRQVRPADVTRRGVIAAMLEVPREDFAPESLRAAAYSDSPLPLGGGRQILEPRVQAKLLDLAELEPEEKILIVGAGTGYGAALAGKLSRHVTALESDPALAEKARALLEPLAPHVRVVVGDLTAGAPDSGPYDVILLEGGVETALESLETLDSQLAPGGRLIFVSLEGPMGRARLAAKGDLRGRVAFDAAATALPGFERKPGFVF